MVNEMRSIAVDKVASVTQACGLSLEVRVTPDIPAEEGRDAAMQWNEEMAGAQRKRQPARSAKPDCETSDRPLFSESGSECPLG